MTQQFGTLIKYNKQNMYYLNKKDTRMRFNNGGDPIFFVFDYIENRPMTELAKDFVKETFNEIANFVSKAVR
ncbi:hypothetical protein IJ818_05620 [bacterium]|nr:hypothetical protein [bacterium]